MYRQVDPSLPVDTTLLDHFSSKVEMFGALRDWATTEVYDDIVATLPEIQASEKEIASTTSEGYVYLIRSGAFYKIGRGADLENRFKQIRTSLPDTATIEHSIRTDDPPGIEAYWHRRFDEKRRNGEWFELTSADVAAFRKRKYQ